VRPSAWKMIILKLVNGPRTTPDVIFDIGTGTVRLSIVDEV
jgi:hypothetical protein